MCGEMEDRGFGLIRVRDSSHQEVLSEQAGTPYPVGAGADERTGGDPWVARVPCLLALRIPVSAKKPPCERCATPLPAAHLRQCLLVLAYGSSESKPRARALATA
jgi:hypothetical protein